MSDIQFLVLMANVALWGFLNLVLLGFNIRAVLKKLDQTD